MRVALQAREVHVEMNPSEEAASAPMPLRPARIPPMSGCLSLFAAAAISACGGGQSTIDASSSVFAFKADGTRTLMIYSLPASIYTVEYSADLTDSSNWVRWFQGSSTTFTTQVPGLDPTLGTVFYRAFRASP